MSIDLCPHCHKPFLKTDISKNEYAILVWYADNAAPLLLNDFERMFAGNTKAGYQAINKMVSGKYLLSERTENKYKTDVWHLTDKGLRELKRLRLDASIIEAQMAEVAAQKGVAV